MFNPDKDFLMVLLEELGKDGKSINSLAKDLESRGIKHHRLILTGYLRALADTKILREIEIPPSKVYTPIKPVNDSIYTSVSKAVNNIGGSDDMVHYVLYRLFKRPIFRSELIKAGVRNITGTLADANQLRDSKRALSRAGNVNIDDKAYLPEHEYPDEYANVIADILIDSKDCRHLVLESKQSTLI